MNRLFTKRTRVMICALFIISTVSFSQFNNVDFLRSAPSDGVKFIQAYVSPWANAFGAGLNGSWYNTAKPHKLGGFDITTGFNVGFVPSSAESFDISSLGLSSNITPATGNASTVAGPKGNSLAMTYKENGVTLASFNTPQGTGWKMIPLPSAQVGIGLPFGTEIKLRFLPKIQIKKGDVSMWGVGLMHSLLQYIPGSKMLPFDVSLFAGYTKLTGNVPLKLQPEVTYPNTITLQLDNQNMSTNIEALNISAIGSISIPILTIYGGLGYSNTRTSMVLSGNFPTPKYYTNTGKVEYRNDGVRTGESFPKIDIKNFSGMRANIGFRIKLAVITIHADYTRAQYNVLSTGLGISFR